MYERTGEAEVLQHVFGQATKKGGGKEVFSEYFPIHSMNLIETQPENKGIHAKNGKKKELLVDTDQFDPGARVPCQPDNILLFMIMMCSVSLDEEWDSASSNEYLISIIDLLVRKVFHESGRSLASMLFGLSDDPVCISGVHCREWCTIILC